MNLATPHDEVGSTGRSLPARLRPTGRFALLLVSGMALAALAAAVSIGNTIEPVGIVIHHSGASHTAHGDVLTGQAIASAHRRRGFGAFYWGRRYYIGYHYVIGSGGAQEAGRPERCRGAHAVGFNDYLGICLIGNFELDKDGAGTSPTPPQLLTAIRTTKSLMTKYQIPLHRVVLHRDLSGGTICPGGSFPWEEFKRGLVAPVE